MSSAVAVTTAGGEELSGDDAAGGYLQHLAA